METHAPAPERVFRLAVAPIRDITVRDSSGTGDGSWTMEGYAAVYDQETVLWDGRWFRLRERIARGAFTNVLARVAAGTELVHFNFGHDMNTSIAATNVSGIGGLELSEDFHGLRFFARVDPDDPDAMRLAAKMRRKVVAQASFAFTIAEEHVVEIDTLEDGRDDELWEIDEVAHLYDVCACPQGAYPQTESHLRSLTAASLGRAGLDPAGLDRRTDAAPAPAGEEPVAPEEHSGGGEASSRARTLEQLRAHAHTETRRRKLP
jgi:HK97 family phage prohead protease